MDDRVVANQGPYKAEVEAGQTYAWCRCARSTDQPWCDGAHKSAGLKPLVFKAEKSETLYLCGGRHTGDEPNCDGFHSKL